MVSNLAVKELEAQLTSECRARSATQYANGITMPAAASRRLP
jgi:hypothetical protein